jgi:hypothetical protein
LAHLLPCIKGLIHLINFGFQMVTLTFGKIYFMTAADSIEVWTEYFLSLRENYKPSLEIFLKNHPICFPKYMPFYKNNFL